MISLSESVEFDLESEVMLRVRHQNSPMSYKQPTGILFLTSVYKCTIFLF